MSDCWWPCCGSQEFNMRRYNMDGDVLWSAKVLGGRTLWGTMAYDSVNDHLYYVDYSDSTIGLSGNPVLISKWDVSAGRPTDDNLIWSLTKEQIGPWLNVTNVTTMTVPSMLFTLAASGDLIIAAKMPTVTQCYILRLDSNGNLKSRIQLFNNRSGSTEIDGYDVNDIITDSSDDIYVSHTFRRGALVSSGLYEWNALTKWDVGGVWKWSIDPLKYTTHLGSTYWSGKTSNVFNGQARPWLRIKEYSGSVYWADTRNRQFETTPTGLQYVPDYGKINASTGATQFDGILDYRKKLLTDVVAPDAIAGIGYLLSGITLIPATDPSPGMLFTMNKSTGAELGRTPALNGLFYLSSTISYNTASATRIVSAKANAPATLHSVITLRLIDTINGEFVNRTSFALERWDGNTPGDFGTSYSRGKTQVNAQSPRQFETRQPVNYQVIGGAWGPRSCITIQTNGDVIAAGYLGEGS